MYLLTYTPKTYIPWNKGKLVGQKPPLKLEEVWAIRIRLKMAENARELALFNLAIDSKLRSCDLVRLRVRDVWHNGIACRRAKIMQRKTQQPVQFEISGQTRLTIESLVSRFGMRGDDYLFRSRIAASEHLSTRQYARILKRWVESIGLDPTVYGTHSIRRTKVSLIYKRTKNIRAVQLLLGHTQLESTVKYLGIEVDDALEMAENTEV